MPKKQEKRIIKAKKRYKVADDPEFSLRAKRIKAWAIVGKNGELYLYSWDGVPAIFSNKKTAKKYNLKVVPCQIILTP